MEPSHKIAVLLAEYNTLRAEVLAARGNVLQAIGLTVPIVMGLVGLAFSPTLALPRWIIWGIPVAGFFYLCISFVWNEINMHKFTKQLREIDVASVQTMNRRYLHCRHNQTGTWPKIRDLQARQRTLHQIDATGFRVFLQAIQSTGFDSRTSSRPPYSMTRSKKSTRFVQDARALGTSNPSNARK
jgi:hypothetical protein